jgi:myo-inositol-1(or 4)-monophosphatase
MQALDFAIEVAQEAGSILLQHRGTPLTRTIKYHQEDFATEADYALEKYILSRIAGEFPDDAVVAEESGKLEKIGAEYTWIIDPLDGTKNFASGSEDFGVLICRCKGEVLENAVAFNPVKKLLATGSVGKGTFLNGRQVNLRDIAGLDSKVIGANTDLHLALKIIGRSRSKSSAISTLLDTLLEEHGAYVASAGFVWDFAVSALLLAEAGWKVTNFSNQPYRWDGKVKYGWPGIIAASPAMHEKVVHALERTRT